MPFLLPLRTLLRHYAQPNAFFVGYDAFRRDEKMNIFIIRRSRIEAESKSNRHCRLTPNDRLLTVAAQNVAGHVIGFLAIEPQLKTLWFVYLYLNCSCTLYSMR